MRAWRWPARLLIPALVAGGLFIDSQIDRGEGSEAVAAEAVTVVRVSDSDALSSTWLCPTAAVRQVEGAGSEALVRLVLVNTSVIPTRARVEFLSASSASRVVEVPLAGLSSERLTVEPDAVDDLSAAVIEAPTGGVVAARELSSPAGVDLARCASGANDQWFVPTGDTQRDATEEVVIFNPFASDAIIDMSFATEAETGAFVAVDLEGLVVAPRTSLRVDLGEHVRRRDVAASAISVRAGQVVVDGIQTYEGSAGRAGFGLTLGAARVAERWTVPVGLVDDQNWMEIRVMNPSDEVAEVDLASASAGLGGDPIAVTVGPREIISVPVRPFLEDAPEVPTLEVVSGAPFGVVVESANGVPVTVGVEIGWGDAASPVDQADATDTDADTDVEADDGADASEDPAETADPDASDDPDEAEVSADPEANADDDQATGAARGISWVGGVSQPSQRWLGLSAEAGEASLWIMSPTSEPRIVQINSLDGTSLGEVTVGGLEIETFPVPAGVSLVVEADGEVSVAMRQTAGGVGLGAALAVPF